MSISLEQLHHLSSLAYLEAPLETTSKLKEDMNAMMDFVEQLRLIDTAQIQPLMHPLDMYQMLRPDEAKPCNCVDALSTIAPQFEDNLYWVPKIIK